MLKKSVLNTQMEEQRLFGNQQIESEVIDNLLFKKLNTLTLNHPRFKVLAYFLKHFLKEIAT